MSAVGVSIEVTGPADASPPRRSASVRRTTTIDMTWPGGMGTDLLLRGRGRDLRTVDASAEPQVIAAEQMRVVVAPDRTISSVETTPEWPELQSLLGVRSGSGFRGVLGQTLPLGRSDEGPLHLLLDDLPGATLISGFAFAQWVPVERLLAAVASKPGAPGHRMDGICTGFMPGSSGLAPDGSSRWTHRTQEVAPLESAPDPHAWHEIRQIDEVAMRRARRIDVWVEDGIVRVDAMFQDSATRPEGGRIAVHEYTLTATVDLATRTLRSVQPVPRVLPYAECPLAVRNAGSLVGTPLADLRLVVLDRLKGVAGCTHLNDAMRALADVARLAELID